MIAGLLIALSLDVGESAAVVSPYYEGSSGKQQVAIAVNVDWGEEYVPAMLSLFREREAAATFFLTGRWTELFPAVARQIADAGMEIGNHGLKHQSPNSMSYEENLADIAAAAEIIERETSVAPTLFAPASGECEEQVLQAAADSGCAVILWSVDTIDWQKPTPAVMVERVSAKLHDGAIILMHPTENTVAALPAILDAIDSAGYTVVPISTLIQENV